MKPKLVHQEAMDFSFKAKQALAYGNYTDAFDLYIKAAELESSVAEFYFDKPELEPTRSVVIRSAAFLNIKAGQIDNAKRFIFFGLLNTSDTLIKEQLNNALELAVSIGNIDPKVASKEYNFINMLRQRSVHYILEPASRFTSGAVSLSMITDFSEGYLKSLKAYAISKFKKVLQIGDEVEEAISKEIETLINPLVTSSAYGSFKFSIANDFLYREGESHEVIELKANIVSKYHNEIFVNPLSDEDISSIKKNYLDKDINEIFRPLSKIKANNTPYKIGYFDTDDFSKKVATKIVNTQRKKLLTVKSITQEDIGELENSITHKRSSPGGKVHTKTIFKEQLRSFEFDIKINQIEPTNLPTLILNEDIILSVNFNSNVGFTISYDDFRLAHTNVEYDKALKGFHNDFNEKAIRLINTSEKNEEEQKDWDVLSKLIGNLDALKK